MCSFISFARAIYVRRNGRRRRNDDARKTRVVQPVYRKYLERNWIIIKSYYLQKTFLGANWTHIGRMRLRQNTFWILNYFNIARDRHQIIYSFLEAQYFAYFFNANCDASTKANKANKSVWILICTDFSRNSIGFVGKLASCFHIHSKPENVRPFQICLQSTKLLWWLEDF